MMRATVMRNVWLAGVGAAAMVAAGPAWAGDKPLYRPAPTWVKPAALPADPVKSDSGGGDEAPVRLLLSDQQLSFELGGVTVYNDIAVKILRPQGLAAGNISLPWKPDTDTLIVHRVTIRRGDRVIDVLAAGQTFTVVRREANLENAMLDGVLTANIQPDGLQVGDVLEFAVSIVSRDPVMKRNAEFVGANWNGFPITRAHLRAHWPLSMPVRFDVIGGLPVSKPMKSNGDTAIDVTLDNAVSPVVPKGAPTRFRIGRMIELSTFASWGDVAALMAPLYTQTAVLPAQGPLLAEVERIRNTSPDPKARAEAALALVQDRVRYLALAMGQAGLVPADTATTWSRRFGDCKGKTVLLVAILHSLGIEAVPVAVSGALGDGLDARLPRVGALDHVLVRSTIAGRTYWLDGTRTGDVSLDRLTVPAFGWGLPLIAKGSALVRMMPAPLDTPSNDLSIRIDATKGLMTPAPVRIENVMRGDTALAFNAAIANLSGDARDRALRDYWKGQYDFIDVATATTSFDEKTGERRLSMEGKARMDWSSGWYEADGMGVGYRADFSRDAGPDQAAPFAVPYPYYSHAVETILLPPGFPELKSEGKNDLDRTIAGIQYRRHVKLSAGVFIADRTERSLVPEFPAADAPAAQVALRDLAGQTVYIRRPTTYRVTDEEMPIWQAKTLTTDSAYVERGIALAERGRLDEAIKDYDAALAIEPKSPYALANRGIQRVHRGDFAGATQDLDAVAGLDARNPVLWRARALMAEMKGDPKAARAAYAKSLEIDADNAFARMGMARTARSLGDNDAAMAEAAAVIATNPVNTEAYLLRANILRSTGKPKAVDQELNAMLNAAPADPMAHVTAAKFYGSLGRATEASAEFEKALAIKPAAYIYLNRLETRPRSDRDGRMADIAAALKLQPDYSEALIARARMLTDDGKFAEAATIYDAQLVKSPKNAGLLVARGIARMKAGDASGGEADLTEAGKQMTQAVQFNNLCWVKATAGVALQSALADCDRAIAMSPKIAGYLDSRGLVLLRLRRTDEAIATYSEALALAPSLPSSLFGRGVAWKTKGDTARATADFTAAAKSNPKVREEFADYGVTS